MDQYGPFYNSIFKVVFSLVSVSIFFLSYRINMFSSAAYSAQCGERGKINICYLMEFFIF
jgi:hypothetical protein